MNNKDKYGEVFTPPSLVDNIIKDCFSFLHLDNVDDITIFEPGAGKGIFFEVMQNQQHIFGDNFKYILNEINHENLLDLQNVSAKYSNNVEIIMKDLLSLKQEDFKFNSADIVVGNLPFNSHSKKFVPSLALNNKDDTTVTKPKSITLWNKMVHFCFENILKPGGLFLAIIPCIWLKKDKGGVYSLFTEQNEIVLLKVFDCQSANKLFKYNCQTPICYVLVRKRMEKEASILSQRFKLFDKDKSHGYLNFTLRPGLCIPTNYVSNFINHHQYLLESGCESCYNNLRKISTLKPICIKEKVCDFLKGGLEEYITESTKQHYKIITGSLYNKKTDVLTLNGFVSTTPALYQGQPKLILPHKRCAKFFKDYTGEYSCFGRDMYIFLCESNQQIDLLYDFFNGNIINKMIGDGFTVRMNFIEKYVFQYIPWIFDEKFDSKCYETTCNQ
jgi:hypothetical protein